MRFVYYLRTTLFCFICAIAVADDNQSIHGFPYTVNVSLSHAAAEKINAQKETVLVNTFFEGEPLPDISVPPEIMEYGRVYLGEEVIELHEAGTATFSGDGLISDYLGYINKDDLTILINVWSGRKSSSFNIISCGIFYGKLSEIVNSNIDITCKLIEE